MLTGDSDASWRKFGETEPYYGVLTGEMFRKANLNESNAELFFQSGEKHISDALNIIRQRIDPTFTPKRALEFGCGVGRLSIPLARVCHEVVALDISEGMRTEAKKNCTARGVANATFLPSDDRLSHVQGTFNLLFSHIVFQHIAPRRTETILRSMLERLDHGGVGCLHFGYAGTASGPRRVFHHCRKVVPLLNNFANLIERRSFFQPMMQMNRSNLNRLFRILQESGCHRIYVEFTGATGANTEEFGVVCFFQKVTLPSFGSFEF